MIYVQYDEAVSTMEKGLSRYFDADTALHFAKIFAGNSLDGVYSHGMNRFPRYLSDMDKGFCDRTVLTPERVSGFGGLEVWDAHFGVGPLIAEQITNRSIELAKAHGVACIALRNNSHWLRAGRYGLMMADAGMMGICFTNTALNLVAYGAKTSSTGNNPITFAIPRKAGSLVMDMAVSQYAMGKMEIMAQEGQMLPTPCGYDTEGNETCDPREILKSRKMMPMALWKGSALSIMLDIMASALSLGRASHDLGVPAEGERGASQVFICIHPEAVIPKEEMDAKIEETLAFLAALEPKEGTSGVHAPGEHLEKTRAMNLSRGIPVTEATWQKIVDAAL